MIIILTDETEDEDANEEYIEETNKDAVVIAAAKLVVSNTVPKVCILTYPLLEERTEFMVQLILKFWSSNSLTFAYMLSREERSQGPINS